MKCSICLLAPQDLAMVDQALRNGESEQSVAQRFGVSRSAVHRHREAHLAQSGEVLPPTSPDAEDEILAELRTLQKVTRAILVRCMEAQGDADPTALKAIHEASRLLGQQALLQGRLVKVKLGVHVDLRTSQAFSELSRAAARSLKDFPEARAALSAELTRSRKRK